MTKIIPQDSNANSQSIRPIVQTYRTNTNEWDATVNDVVSSTCVSQEKSAHFDKQMRILPNCSVHLSKLAPQYHCLAKTLNKTLAFQELSLKKKKKKITFYQIKQTSSNLGIYNLFEYLLCPGLTLKRLISSFFNVSTLFVPLTDVFLYLSEQHFFRKL